MNRFHTLSAARHEPEAGPGKLFSLFWATLAGLLVPCVVLVVGLISLLLQSGELSQSTVRLGVNLYVRLPASFVDQPPLVQLTQLTSLSFAMAVVLSVAVWRHRRLADRRAAAITKSLHQKVLKQSVRRAELEGAAAQSLNAQKLIGRHLPSVQSGLSLWYRSLPRSLFLLLGCVSLALLVHIWLAIVAVISGVMVWRLYRQVRGGDADEAGRWELPQLRAQMAALVGRAPKMARLQAQGIAEASFQHELDQLYQKLEENDAHRGRVWPLLFLAASAATAIMVIGLGLNLLETDAGLSLSSAVVLGLSLAGAVSGVWRLQTLGRRLRASGTACDAVYAYLRKSDGATPSEQRVGLAGLRDGVEFRDVTLVDSHGQAILNHITTEFTPKSLVTLLGTDSVSPQAMVELLMGFGRPGSGEVRIDGLKLLEVHPASLAKNVMWIEPSGPLWDGTIEENLSAGSGGSISNADIVDALREVDVYEQIQRLPEGLSTYASVEGFSLSTEATYGIGLARALLHRPPILLVNEPPAPNAQLADDPCLKAIKKLVDQGSLVVMLPRRLQTLRTADRVILLNGPNLAGEGNHSQLLSDSDLYRHLNYLLFNPYRPGR
ncbi:putative multidrug resistance ABC transporter ATP-binding/permease protein YheH [Stieleria neptunia]|uniref:Putative multidrug resistance ABC transporter ATP-binding/permease protein YheH n=1 Tax=Stieleria neptunia TaxID=2527979 RepID=A0A518HMN0_9BACT|nr:ABC transporter ATP-binding protein [Stieleria neptunia]QDV42080.1 putative multidrug resistance ABC transporter ATP-binding/permease protein YheH [Stieleria neptunia]